jgi:hypothetical protein
VLPLLPVRDTVALSGATLPLAWRRAKIDRSR